MVCDNHKIILYTNQLTSTCQLLDVVLYFYREILNLWDAFMRTQTSCTKLREYFVIEIVP